MGDETQKTINFGDKLSEFSSCLSFFLSTSTAATYIFTARTCTTTIITLEPCTLNAEYQHFNSELQHFKLEFFLNVFNFLDTIERGDRGCERRPKDRVKKTGLLSR
jgi:hypothetical protein